MATMGVSSQGVAPLKNSAPHLWFSASLRHSSLTSRCYFTWGLGRQNVNSLQKEDDFKVLTTNSSSNPKPCSVVWKSRISTKLESCGEVMKSSSAQPLPNYGREYITWRSSRGNLCDLERVDNEEKWIQGSYLNSQLAVRRDDEANEIRSAVGRATVSTQTDLYEWSAETRRWKAAKVNQFTAAKVKKLAQPNPVKDIPLKVLEEEYSPRYNTNHHPTQEGYLHRQPKVHTFLERPSIRDYKQVPVSLDNIRDYCPSSSVTSSDDLAHIETRIEKINPKRESQAQIVDHHSKLLRIYDKVLIVDSVSAAKRVMKKLKHYRHLVHACDTEVAKIEVKDETPVDHGEIICFSIYSGPEANFDGKSCIWVDVLDGGKDVLMEFASFFEDPSLKKVWHNYSFDCHVLENYGFKVSGFHADTMHLARLWDSSRRINGGYTLEALTGNPKVMSGSHTGDEDLNLGKISMKSIFGKKKLKKDGSEGKLITIAPVEELQREERVPWICYSALDSISTLKLFESLKSKLMARDWIFGGLKKGSMYNFYEEYWRPFGELLVKMEAEGMLVDRTHLQEIEKVAVVEQKIAVEKFRKWASKYCSDAQYMNVGSDAQLRQLFFGGILNRKDPYQSLPEVRTFKVPNIDKVIEEGKKAPTKFRSIKLHNLGINIEIEKFTATGWPSVSGDALKAMAGKISADLYNFADDTDNSAYKAFGGGKEGREACDAIAALCEICSIDSLISNFIIPLQGSHISGTNGRIHSSLNINTETGRLSARRPNLQNQPALEKDRYKIRQAFIAAPGNSLIVADYGQLELRILAHLANCKSMLDAFKAGGDFHSRTAMNMYWHIREAVEEKKVLLEWYAQPGQEKPPVPLLKDAFASERRKAKMLNFSIAYGKTPVGLSLDWKVSVPEAKQTVDLWYNERQEVREWQEDRKEEARTKHCVYTLLGRARHFPSMANVSNAQKSHIERAAINTPVQGSAADVAMCAMLEISRNARLKELGWRLLLQVHDEVILEGPSESAEVAKAIVVECMSKPFNGTNILNVELVVDAKCAQNWYAAK